THCGQRIEVAEETPGGLSGEHQGFSPPALQGDLRGWVNDDGSAEVILFFFELSGAGPGSELTARTVHCPTKLHHQLCSCIIVRTGDWREYSFNADCGPHHPDAEWT